MPELISASLIGAVGLAALRPKMFQSSALSAEGRAVARQTAEIYRHGEASWSLFGPLTEAQRALRETATEASSSGWDGAVAPPVPAEALAQAEAFLAALPHGLPMPEFSVEPDDGSLSLEWHAGYRRVFSVSVGRSMRLPYAGLDGTDKWHGVAQFDGIVIPQRIVESIRQIRA